MPAARAESDAVGGANALTPIAEETESEWTKATPTRGKRSGGRGSSLSSGKISLRGSLSGRLLPGELRSRKTIPPSSIKRMKSKEAAVVAAVPKKPKLQHKPAKSGSLMPVQTDVQTTNALSIHT